MGLQDLKKKPAKSYEDRLIMAVWIPFKATPPERNGGRKKQQGDRTRLCKICGKPSYTGPICGSCKQFIDAKKAEERTEKHGKYRH